MDAAGNIIVTGSIQITDATPSHHDIFIAKLTSGGQVLWKKTFGGDRDDHGLGLLVNSENDIVLIASTNSNTGFVHSKYGWDDIVVCRISSDGDINQLVFFGGDFIDEPTHILQNNAGNYILTAASRSSSGDITQNFGQFDFWIAELDPSFALIWQKTFGGTDDDMPIKTIQLYNGSYLTLGSTSTYEGDFYDNRGDDDVLLVNFESYGNKIWQKCYGGAQKDAPADILQLPKGGIMVAASTLSSTIDVSENNGGYDAWLFTVNGDGDILWEQSYGSSGNEKVNAIKISSNGIYMLGTSGSSWPGTAYHGKYDFWLTRLNPQTSNIEDQYFLGGYNYDDGRSLLIDGSGTVFMAGISSSNDGYVRNNSGEKDGWIIAIKPTNLSDQQFRVHPNPTTGVLYINDIPENASIKVFDLSGAIVFQNDVNTPFSAILDLSFLPSGTYIINVSNDQSDLRAKVIRL